MGQPNPSATKIMIIRHAEKPSDSDAPYGVNLDGVGDGESLTVPGWQRAGALAVLFAPSRGPFQDPSLTTPNFIYASKAVPHTDSDSMRPQETVTPLINKLKLKESCINFSFLKGQEPLVVESALACMGVVLICWEHKNIHKIVHHIMKNQNKKISVPKQWPDDRYDMVWIFDWDSSTAGYVFHQVNQNLLENDNS